MMGRRTFLQTTLGAMAAACTSGSGARPTTTAPKAKKKILILGGTGFLGPHLVDAAKTRGHTLTLFNRGKTHPGLFPDIEQLHGDRDGHLEALQGRKWDAVVDTSGYVPRIVKASADLLAPNVGRYIFISTISVYKDEGAPEGMDESAALNTLPAGQENTEKVTGETYGALKALCEKATLDTFGPRGTVVRPGLIVGPLDPSDRFTYWPVRIERGGEVLAPGDGKDPVQFIDGRDVADFCIRLIEDDVSGTFNATGPAKRLLMKELLDACQSQVKTPATLTWVPADFLEKHKVSAWGDMPAWIPFEAPTKGLTTVSSAAGISHGLAYRPLSDTIRDTLTWWHTLPADRTAKLRAGIEPEREKEVLAAWHSAKT